MAPPSPALLAVAVDTTLCVEWKEVKVLSPLSAARPLPRLARQASFDSQDFLQVLPTQPSPAWLPVPHGGTPLLAAAVGTVGSAARCPPGPASPQWLRGCSDVSREPGCILGEISPRCLVAMAMRFVARLQIPHRFPRGHGLGARRGQDGQRGRRAGRCGTAGAAKERALGNVAAVALHTRVCVCVCAHRLGGRSGHRLAPGVHAPLCVCANTRVCARYMHTRHEHTCACREFACAHGKEGPVGGAWMDV